MEEFQSTLQTAKNKLKVADHMFVMTYPLVKDPKLLLAVVENIFQAFEKGMSSLLYYERLFKRIPLFQETFESKFNMFRDKLVPKFKIDEEHIKVMRNLKEILLEHKKSPIEFSRKDRFVICSENYRMKTISKDDIKKYIFKAKLFVSDIERLVSRDGRIFK